MRFCSQCGLPLDFVIEGFASSTEQIKREKRQATGIGLMLATVLMLLNFIIVYGAVTLPLLTNPVFFWVWLSFVIGSLVTAGFGVANLTRGGFFKGLKEREKRLQLMKKRQQSLGNGNDVKNPPLLNTQVSVTENTTRELERGQKP